MRQSAEGNYLQVNGGGGGGVGEVRRLGQRLGGRFPPAVAPSSVFKNVCQLGVFAFISASH